VVGHLLYDYLEQNNLGELIGGSGPLRILPNQVRMPIFPLSLGKVTPNPGASRCTPLAGSRVEVISPGNTPRRWNGSEESIFRAARGGMDALSWPADCGGVAVARRDQDLGESEMLDGGDVLPGLTCR